MKAINSAALPILEITKRTLIKIGTWTGQLYMDDFDIVLGMNFLLEHKVILTPIAKCLVVRGSTQQSFRLSPVNQKG